MFVASRVPSKKARNPTIWFVTSRRKSSQGLDIPTLRGQVEGRSGRKVKVPMCLISLMAKSCYPVFNFRSSLGTCYATY